MTQDEFNALRPGDIVRGEASKHPYVVTGNYGCRVTAVASVDMISPLGWELVRKAASSDPST